MQMTFFLALALTGQAQPSSQLYGQQPPPP
jgi:hypothetical protein